VSEVVSMLRNPVRNIHSTSACWRYFYLWPWTLCFGVVSIFHNFRLTMCKLV
jgi:hypothetical protein